MEVVAVIPARSGSKGVPDKNIRLLAGRPLLAYSIAAARLTRSIDRVLVSTDSKAYALVAKEYGADVPFLRPKEISGDHSTDYDWIRHVLDWMQEIEGSRPKYLVHLRPTTPLREVQYIEGAIKNMRKSDHATALRSVHEMPESSYKSFEVEDGYLRCVGSGTFDIEAVNAPRQKFRKTYHGNGYVDIIRSSYVMERQEIHGDRVLAYVTPSITEVDTEDDFNYLEYQVSNNPLLVQNLFGHK